MDYLTIKKFPIIEMTYVTCPNDIIQAIENNDLDYIINNHHTFNPNCYNRREPILHMADKWFMPIVMTDPRYHYSKLFE